MFVLAHLSDPHLPTPPGVRLAALANKRLFGYLSWRLNRSRVHRPEVLKALVADLKASGADHLVVTGDLINIALPAEFAAAGSWLEALGRPEAVTVIPGNHDAYVRVTPALIWDQWGPYMAGDCAGDGDDSASLPAGSPDAFPALRRRGPVAVIGLSTAEPSAPGMADGRLGPRQLERLADLLARLGEEGLFRLILLHHPPLDRAVPRRKRLRDADGLRRVIAAHGAELILHGHNHRLQLGELAGPAGPVPVIGAPSASAAEGDEDRCGQYLLYRIGRTTDAWTLSVNRRLFDPRDRGVRRLPAQDFILPFSGTLRCGPSTEAAITAA